MTTRTPLRLKFACSEDWSAFRGDAAKRHCPQCERDVHDLSQMTRAEAVALIERPPPGGVCVRYAHDGQGRVLFRSERYPGRLAWKRLKVLNSS